MAGMSHNMRDPANAPGVRLGPGVDMIAPMPQDRGRWRSAASSVSR